mgnify:CR=1 FL=1
MARKPSKGGQRLENGDTGVPNNQSTPQTEDRKAPYWRRPEAWLLAIFPLIAFALYHQTIHGPFVFDDVPNISANFKMRIYSLDWRALKAAATSEPSVNRWLPNITFAINYYLGGLNVEGYHIVNILIHVITSILVFLFPGPLASAMDSFGMSD